MGSGSGTAPPLVSIIVPAYNAEPFVGETLTSLLGQTYPNIEILVFDDASTDGTAEVVRGFGDAVSYHRQERNRGIYANANDGIARARGEYIAVYHSDDIYEAAIVEREVDYFLEHPDVGAVFCLDTFVDAQGKPYAKLELPAPLRTARPLDYPTVFNSLLRYKNVFLRCPGAMVRAAAYRTVGTYRQELFRNTSDLDMWLRIARRYPIGIVQEHLYRYRHFHGSSAQRYHYLRTEPENYFHIMDHFLAEGDRSVATDVALAKYEGHRAEDHLKIAASFYIQGDRLAARDYLRRVRLRDAARGGRMSPARSLTLFGLLTIASRLPQIPALARWLAWRIFERHARPPGA